MKLNVNELKKFKINSSAVKTNTLLPILSYLKFDKDGTVTKNSLNSFCTQNIKCDETFLVDEKILFNFISNTTSQEIEIKVEENRIVLIDGKLRDKSPTDAVENFPKNDIEKGKSKTLDVDTLQSIATAADFVVNMEIQTAACFVFIGKDYVSGSNNFMAYFNQAKGVPQIVLTKDVAQAISKFDEVEFSENDSYHFFEAGDCKYGFIKPEFKFFDLTKFKDYESEGSFTIDKSELINVNNIILGSVTSVLHIAKFSVAKGKLKYEYSNIDNAREILQEIKVEGSVEGEFNFNVVHMNTLLKAVPDTLLTFHKVKDKYYIIGESGFITLIIGLQP